MGRVEDENLFPCSSKGLFTFLTQPRRIAEVTDPNLGLVFTDAPQQIEAGIELDFKIVSFGQVHEITHKITTFEPHVLVVEEQIEGPMAAWTHRHEYEDTDNGVIKRDIVEFEKPGGIIGLLLSNDTISDQLEDGFHYRNQQLLKLIDTGVIQ